MIDIRPAGDVTIKLNRSAGAVLVLSVLATIAFASGMQQTDAASTVTIGILNPDSGGLGVKGAETRVVALDTVRQFNAYLEEKGADWRLDAEYADSGTNSGVSLSAVQKMNENGVKLVVGPRSSGVVSGISDFTGDNGMMILSCCSSAIALEKPDHVYRMVPSDRQAATLLGDKMDRDGITHAVLIMRDNIWGESYAAALESSFDGTTDRVPYAPADASFADEVSKARSILGPDTGNKAVVVLAYGEARLILAESSKVPALGSVSWYAATGIINDPSIFQDADSASFASKVGLHGYAFAASSANDATRAVDGLVARELPGRTATIYGYSMHDAVWMAGLMIDSARAAGNAITAGSLASHLGPAASAHDRFALDSAGLTFDDNGDLVGGQFEILAAGDDAWHVQPTKVCR